MKPISIATRIIPKAMYSKIIKGIHRERCVPARKLKKLKLANLNKDVFKKNLSVQNCAERFFIREPLKQSIKNVNVHSLKFQIIGKNAVRIKGHPSLQKEINHFVKKVPEFLNVFKYNKLYKEGLANHTLAVYQKLVTNPEFKTLTRRERNILEVAALLHDVGKINTQGLDHPLLDMSKKHIKEFVDLMQFVGKKEKSPYHPILSAEMVKTSLKKLDLPKEDKSLILKLIKNHHFCEYLTLAEGAKRKKVYNMFALKFNEQEFKLAKLLTLADIDSKKIVNSSRKAEMQKRIQENIHYFKHQQIHIEKVTDGFNNAI